MLSCNVREDPQHPADRSHASLTYATAQHTTVLETGIRVGLFVIMRCSRFWRCTGYTKGYDTGKCGKGKHETFLHCETET